VFSVGPRRSFVFCYGSCRVIIKDTDGRLIQSSSRRQPARIWDWEQRNRNEKSGLLSAGQLRHECGPVKERLSVWFEDFMCAVVEWYLEHVLYNDQEPNSERFAEKWPLLRAATASVNRLRGVNVEWSAVWKSARALFFSVVTTCMWSINPLINSNPVYCH
jgi:hypothetical protein